MTKFARRLALALISLALLSAPARATNGPYQGQALNLQTNQPYPGASVSVYIWGTNTFATIYDAATGTIPLSNPMTADQNGIFAFQANSSLAYQIVWSSGGYISPLWSVSPAGSIPVFNMNFQQSVCGNEPTGSLTGTPPNPTFNLIVPYCSYVGGLHYVGEWNASTNSPTLASGVGTSGYYYFVGEAGSTTLDGISSWSVGDAAVFNGTIWQKIPAGLFPSAILTIGSSITGGTPGQGLYNGTGGQANTLQQFPYGAGVVTALGVNEGSYGAVIPGYLSTAQHNVSILSNLASLVGTPDDIIAIGANACLSSTTGYANTCIGTGAAQYNTTGNNFVAIGQDADNLGTTAHDFVAIGSWAALHNVASNYHIAIGSDAMVEMGQAVTAGNFVNGVSYTIQTVGTTNFTSIGASANTIGVVFTASGVGSGTGTAYPTSIQNDIALGFNTCRGLVSGSNVMCLGANITGLPPNMQNAILISDGDNSGYPQIEYNYSATSMWVVRAPIVSMSGAPSISGSCGIASFVGNLVGTFNTNEACTAGLSITLSFGTPAPHGYACDLVDRTQPTTIFTEAPGNTTTNTTFNVSGATSGASDSIRYWCTAY